MLVVERSQRRWLIVFGVALSTLVGLAAWLSLRLPDFREPAFNFYAMKRGEIFNVYGLTRRQEGSVKLGFAETYPAPDIGLFGNHIVNDFGADAFGHSEDAEYFFNYYYANLSLPEIYRYLLHVEQQGHLPKKLILVQITPPNADNGRFIVNLGSELPPDIVMGGIAGKEFLRNPLVSGRVGWEVIDNWLHEVLNYNTFILSIVQNGGYKDRTVNRTTCHDDIPVWMRKLPEKLQNLFGAVGFFDVFCLRRLWYAAYQRDGSTVLKRDVVETAAVQYPETIVQNEDPLGESDRGLRAGDEREIAHQMRAIEAIGARHGIKVVFIVPPVYETDRHESVVNQIFDRALTLVPEIAILDHRSMHSDPLLFGSSIHPSRLYYRIVADELRQRGFIE